MHELALTQGILRIVEAEQKRSGFSTVKEIRLKIGEYSGVIPECICEFFPLAAKDSPAEKAELILETVPAEFTCSLCGAVGIPDREKACCAACGSTEIRMTAGREFYVESLKVE